MQARGVGTVLAIIETGEYFREEAIMRYLSSFIMKWIVIAAVLLVVYSAVYTADAGRVLLMSMLFTAVSFLADVFILPRVDNTTETVLDLFLSFFLLWAFGAWLISGQVPLVAAALISTIVIAVGEWYLHSYMKKNVFHQGIHTPSHA